MLSRHSFWWYRTERSRNVAHVSLQAQQTALSFGLLKSPDTEQAVRLNRSRAIAGTTVLIFVLTSAVVLYYSWLQVVTTQPEPTLLPTQLKTANIQKPFSQTQGKINTKSKLAIQKKQTFVPAYTVYRGTVTEATVQARAALYPEAAGSALVAVTLLGATTYLTIMAGALPDLHHWSLDGLLQEAWLRWHGWERSFSTQQNNLVTLLKQMIFLSICERVLLPKQLLSALYTLMFCTIVTYCIGYAAEIFYRQHWSFSIRMGGPTSSIRHLALTTTNIVLEWTRAVTFITTVVFLLLILGLEKGLESYTPTTPYIVIATLYWLASEKVCRTVMLEWLLDHRLRCFETLEEAYVPLFLGALQLSMVGLFTVPCVLMGNLVLGVAGLLVIRMEYLQLLQHYLDLTYQLTSLSTFRSATDKELNHLNDRCAICLSTMETARATCCQHYYHADCLLQLIRLAPYAPRCPICQTQLMLTHAEVNK